jgi:hypothetical protein
MSLPCCALRDGAIGWKGQVGLFTNKGTWCEGWCLHLCIIIYFGSSVDQSHINVH